MEGTVKMKSLSMVGNGMLLPLTASFRVSVAGFRCNCSKGRGFGPPSDKKPAKSRTNNGIPKLPDVAPDLSSRIDAIPTDLLFEERLQAVRRSALQQKKAGEEKQYGAINYDAPLEELQPGTEKPLGLGAKVGVVVATVVFGLVFAFGDFLPSYSPSQDSASVATKISPEERARLETRLQQFEQALSISREDTDALEGAAVTLAELGEYDKAVARLEELTKKKPNDPDAFRLLGEVKYELKDYDGSAKAYRTSAMVSNSIDFEVLRGTTNALLAAKKPGEAVQVLLSVREQLNKDKPVINEDKFGSNPIAESSQVDPIQVDLLLGKAYSDWGRVSDAIAIYEQLISSHPDDFRGYLAKGIILKENGNVGGAERMFIQARFYAPEKARGLVERYSK